MPAHTPAEKCASYSPVSILVSGVMGGCVAILGLAVLLGWYTHSVSLVQLRPHLVPMPVNTALSFLLCGLSLLALAAGWLRLVLIGSLLASAVGLLTLGEYIRLRSGDRSIFDARYHHGRILASRTYGAPNGFVHPANWDHTCNHL